jgi:hypothetical protein
VNNGPPSTRSVVIGPSYLIYERPLGSKGREPAPKHAVDRAVRGCGGWRGVRKGRVWRRYAGHADVEEDAATEERV